jgi:hypothetical protein
MPHFMVKITTREGDIRQPIVANSNSDEDACELVKYLTDTGDKIEAEAVRLNPDEARKQFGDIQLNHASICWDWAWKGEGDSDEFEIKIG